MSPDLNEHHQRKKVFVTGASGLVGGHLIARLIAQGHSVVATYRGTVPTIADAAQVQWVKGDILDILLLEEHFQGIDHVYHCAAMVSFHPADKDLMMQTNVEGTASVVNAALLAGVKKLCYVSSVAALGTADGNGLIGERNAFVKRSDSSNYAVSKFMAENEVWRAVGEGLNCVMVNPAIILGAGDWTKGSSQIFKSVYEAFPWYAEGVNGFTDVNDVVTAMTMLMENDISGEKFIVSCANKTYREVFTLIAHAFQKPVPHKAVTPFLAALVWRLEAIKSFFTKQKPLVTKETARDALSKTMYDNSKLLQFLPGFSYTPLEETIGRVCNELKAKYQLP